MPIRYFTFTNFTKLVALGALVLAIAPTAKAQNKQAASFATIKQTETLGIRQGDYIIPYSSLPDPSDPTALHTNSIIYCPRPGSALRASLWLLSSLSMPVNPSLGIALAQTREVLGASVGDTGDTEDDQTPIFTPFGSGIGGTFSPSDLKKAYGVTGSGSGVIVVVGAYNYPTALADFNAFSTYYGLPTQSTTNGATASSNTVFQVVYATGRPPATVAATTSDGWNQEAALDFEWAHAMAPNAKIVLVLGASPSYYNLFNGAVNKANNIPGVKEISMSFGSSEFSSETSSDTYFQKSGIVYLASSGDFYGSISYPACSSFVMGVGGTNLVMNSTYTTVTSETAWYTGYDSSSGQYAGTGGNISQYIALPSYQTGLKYPASNGGANSTTLPRRGSPDMSAVGDPATGVGVYWKGNWYGFGGTSLSSPLVAGMMNSAGTFRASSTAQLNYLYGLYNGASYSTYFRDITQSSNSAAVGTVYSGFGYDLLTGIGSPKGPGAF